MLKTEDRTVLLRHRMSRDAPPSPPSAMVPARGPSAMARHVLVEGENDAARRMKDAGRQAATKTCADAHCGRLSVARLVEGDLRCLVSAVPQKPLVGPHSGLGLKSRTRPNTTQRATISAHHRVTQRTSYTEARRHDGGGRKRAGRNGRNENNNDVVVIVPGRTALARPPGTPGPCRPVAAARTSRRR